MRHTRTPRQADSRHFAKFASSESMSAFIAGNAAISPGVALDPEDTRAIPAAALTGRTANVAAAD